MRPGKVIALVVALLLAAPGAASARSDQQVRREAAALPQRLWEPAPEPVSASGPSLPEDAGGVTPLVAVLLLVGAVGVGYIVGLVRPAATGETAAAAPEPPVAAPAPERQPAPDSIVRDVDARRETCAIALSHSQGRGRFEVSVKNQGDVNRVVAQSLPFDAPDGTVIDERGAAGRAHRRLLVHLIAAGWELEPRRHGPWYERRLTRPLAGRDRREIDRAFVEPRPEGGETEFVALALDEYGNAHEMAHSPRFARRKDGPVEETEPAVAAHRSLLEDLAADGWHVSGTVESWYGATLARRRRRLG